ncbi:MAG TPA: hypothetical protein VH867_06615 [Burkholderiales bacterium]
MPDAAPPIDDHEDSLQGASDPARFDYTGGAELFTHIGMIARTRPTEATLAGNSNGPARMQRRRGITYRRFDNGAEAVRFAIEELPRAHFLASVLVVGGDRYQGVAIEDLYSSSTYPLTRLR